MRRLIRGCIFLVLLLLVLVGLFVAVSWDKARRSVPDEVVGLAETLGVDREVFRGEEPPFEAPADGELSEARVETLLAVHRRVRGEMGPRFEALQERWSGRFEGAFEGSGNGAEGASGEGGSLGTDLAKLGESWSELAGSTLELRSLLGEAREVRDAALEEAGWSRAEYRWVQREAYRALGVEVAAGSLEGWSEVESWLEDQELPPFLEDLAGSAEGEGAEPDAVEEVGDEERDRQWQEAVPEVNRQRVAPHREELRAWLPWAVLGL